MKTQVKGKSPQFLHNFRKIIRKYYKQSYFNKFDNIDEMNSLWQREFTKIDTKINWKSE